jgi:hypothetical protein
MSVEEEKYQEMVATLTKIRDDFTKYGLNGTLTGLMGIEIHPEKLELRSQVLAGNGLNNYCARQAVRVKNPRIGKSKTMLDKSNVSIVFAAPLLKLPASLDVWQYSSFPLAEIAQAIGFSKIELDKVTDKYWEESQNGVPEIFSHKVVTKENPYKNLDGVFYMVLKFENNPLGQKQVELLEHYLLAKSEFALKVMEKAGELEVVKGKKWSAPKLHRNWVEVVSQPEFNGLGIS